jgi:hypothetical protein
VESHAQRYLFCIEGETEERERERESERQRDTWMEMATSAVSCGYIAFEKYNFFLNNYQHISDALYDATRAVYFHYKIIYDRVQ